MAAVRDLFRRTAAWHRPMMWFTALMAVMAVVTALAMLVDGRQLLGHSVWLKPFKFAISIAAYTFTWAWLVSLLPRGRKFAWWVSTVLVVALSVEYVLLMVQASRGHMSHFNMSNPFDIAVNQVMGVAAVSIMAGSLVLAVVLMCTRISGAADRWAVRAGAALSVVGMAFGPMMTTPTVAQKAALKDRSTFDGIIGAHSVGAPDGGPGMWLTGWSLTAGDLRVPHMVGLHALQALPLLLFLLRFLATRYEPLRDERVQARLTAIAAAGYAGLIALVGWQALRGQPFAAPDALTLGALAVLVAVLTLAALAVLHAHRPVRAEVPAS